MKHNKTPCPIDIRLLSANAVVPRAQVNAHALQQLGRARSGEVVAGRLGVSEALCHPQNFRFG
ncbi:hypothetical protein D3C71_1842990 [compost metagenome]